MEFRTKKELLEYLGKKGNDNKLVDRMMMRGEVEKKDGVYMLVEKGAVIEELTKELEMYKECYNKNAEDYNELLHKYRELEDKYNGLKEELSSSGQDNTAEKVYRYMTRILRLNVNHDEYIEWLENN